MDSEIIELMREFRQGGLSLSDPPTTCLGFGLNSDECKYLYESAGCSNLKIENILCPHRYYQIIDS